MRAGRFREGINRGGGKEKRGVGKGGSAGFTVRKGEFAPPLAEKGLLCLRLHYLHPSSRRGDSVATKDVKPTLIDVDMQVDSEKTDEISVKDMKLEVTSLQ